MPCGPGVCRWSSRSCPCCYVGAHQGDVHVSGVCTKIPEPKSQVFPNQDLENEYLKSITGVWYTVLIRDSGLNLDVKGWAPIDSRDGRRGFCRETSERLGLDLSSGAGRNGKVSPLNDRVVEGVMTSHPLEPMGPV